MGQTTLRGPGFGLRASDGRFYMTESFLSGTVQEHRV